MANLNLPGKHEPGTAPTSHLAAPAPRRTGHRVGFHHGLLVVALSLPAAAWASGPEPAQAPDAPTANLPFAAGEQPLELAQRLPDQDRPRPRPESVAADRRVSRRSAPAHRASGTIKDAGSVRRATMPARSVPASTTRTAQRRAPSSEPDFLFGQPRLSFGLRGLWHRARAGSDFYDFANEQLFVRRSDDDDHENPDHGLLNFNAPGISFDFGYGVTSRLDVRVGVDYAKSLNESELRNFIGADGLPFTQLTELSQTDLRGELAFALAPRGRAIGQYAWIPSRVVPYVGAGLSFVRHDLAQTGEFVDEIGYFEDTFASNGWGTGVHLFGGADIRMTRHAFLNVEVRHVEASAGLGEDFAGFDPLDLGGLRISAGVRFVF